MRRELFIHFCFWFSAFVLISLLRHFLTLGSWPFWIGGLVGIILPDLDHVIYVYFIKPQDLTSQRINYLIDKKEFVRSVELLYETRNERKGLIFHTIFFQLIFLVLTFWVLTSSGSLFGWGLTLSFAIHLSVDQIIDIMELKNLENWFNYLPFKLDIKQSQIYVGVASTLVLLFGILL